MKTVRRGLTAAEVAERIRQGRVNRLPSSEWRDYAQIVSRNVLTLFNFLVAPAAVALFFLEKYQGAIAVSGMAIANSGLGLIQEIKAKWHLDKLAILVETRAKVWRDGQLQEIPASQVVQDDQIHISAGDAVVADGPVLEARFLEVDEALLTGESDPVRHQPGENLLSGSFCVAGEGIYRADKVGQDAFAQKTSIQARRYHYSTSPLTKTINRLINFLTGITLALVAIYFLLYFMDRVDWDRRGQSPGLVEMAAATITSMVPQGMALTATISFALGAVYMSRKGAIVQRLNAVEAMAAVDVVCTDKTGTLTTNRLRLDRIRVLDLSEEEVKHRLQLFASASVDRKNKNIQAILSSLGETPVELLDQLPFKSQIRYSAVRIKEGNRENILVLGACEALKKYLNPGPETLSDGFSTQYPVLSTQYSNLGTSDWETAWKELLPTGLRILMFAEAATASEFSGVLEGSIDEPPPGASKTFGPTLDGFTLKPLALICLSDELRPEAGQVLVSLAGQGIAFKVISGDNPETVRATISHLQLPLARDPVVTGDELAGAQDRDELIEKRSVFGRVAPQQKVEIVETLQRKGHYVAMIGDGVNDVLPIKRAHLGIAMGEGSQASKTVSGLVLENNNFALLPETLEEGRTILRNLRRAGKLFLVKNVYSLIFIVFFALGGFGLPFPYVPQQVTLLNWMVIGLPALVIALTRERSTAASKTHFLREVGWFALRTGGIFALAGVVTLSLCVHAWVYDEKTQRTMLLSVLVFLGITALWRVLQDGESHLQGDTGVRWLGVAAIPTFLLAMYVPPPRNFFELVPLGFINWVQVFLIVAPTYLLSILSDRISIPQK